MRSRTLFLSATMLGGLALARVADAQLRVVSQAAGPTLDAERAAFRALAAGVAAYIPQPPAPAPLAAAATFGRSERLMILGGAVLLTGLIIGDDPGTVIAIVGAGIGLYGLYLFLDQPTRTLSVGYRLTP